MISPKNILVIGSKGFIGSHLVHYLKGKGHVVYGADVVVDYPAEHYFLIDTGNAGFQDIFQNHQFDWCINCSGAASVPDSLKNPSRDFELNTHNVFRLLNAIREYNSTCRFLNLSSAAVYGNPASLPVKEDSHFHPVSPYGYHKYYSEKICEEFFTFFAVPTCSLRIFSAYGEGLQKQLFWDLHKKAISKEAFTLFGTGLETRDFIYIQDLVRLIELICEKASFQGDAINAANGLEISIADAVNTFYGFYPYKIALSFGGEVRQGDPTRWVADISEIKKLGYKSQFNLKEGLSNYYHWLTNTNQGE